MQQQSDNYEQQDANDNPVAPVTPSANCSPMVSINVNMELLFDIPSGSERHAIEHKLRANIAQLISLGMSEAIFTDGTDAELNDCNYTIMD